MTKEELIQLAQKVRDNTATKEEKEAFFENLKVAFLDLENYLKHLNQTNG